MTNQHHIVPSPEQVDQWLDDAMQLNSTPKYYIARQAALWGADQELEACVKWVSEYCPYFGDYPMPEDKLRAARRPKPPSLNEQALEGLEALPTAAGQVTAARLATIRRALEAIDD
jgi:hypothetical protein